MKYTLLILFSVLLSHIGQSQNDITPAITNALRKGDAPALSAYLQPRIELSLPGKEGVYSQSEAKELLVQFFKEHAAQTFVVKHQGTSKQDDQFRIGELVTDAGVFRVTFYMKKENNTFQIKQLKIESAG